MPTILIKKTGEEPGAASLAVTVPVEQVQEAEARATTAYQRRARLPGFRKGKAPAALVKRQFAEDIRQQTLEDLIRESWKAALAQEALKPIADPHIHNLKWDASAGGPVTFEFHVEVKPEITLERIGKFHLKRTTPKVTEDQVLAQLNALREQKAPWTPVVGDKPELKDLVQVTIATRDVRITLHEIKRQQLPELDDAFAREVGDFESLEALRKVVREDLERDAEREADAQVRRDLIEQIVQANRVVAPRPLVDRALAVYAQAYGIPEERWPDFAQELRPVAEAQVRRDLILDWLVEHHGLRATDAELAEKLQEIAARRGTPVTEVRAALEKAKRLRDLERGLTEEKVFTFLLSQSTVEPA